MVFLAASQSARHLSSAPRNQIDVQHLEVCLDLVDQALQAAVCADVQSASLRRGLRSKAGFDAVDAFFQNRLREALRIFAFMGQTVKNPVELFLYSQDSRVLQRLLNQSAPLDAAEVDRISASLGESGTVKQTIPSPISMAA